MSFRAFEVDKTRSLVLQERLPVSSDITIPYNLLPIVQARRVRVSLARALHCEKGVTLRERRCALIDS